ncbi:site-specific integrase [Deefgea rivuli]|uniref:site-specific integrase n=1 Tax=Deefgea rivuli TaxID=400948 RepID=UPI00047FABBD|nr:site-specific integrase [Deefgea rivuli]
MTYQVAYHLQRRENFFYFRQVIPKNLRRTSQRREFYFSLKVGCVKKAKSIALRLSILADYGIRRIEAMSTSEHSTEIENLNKQLQKQLNFQNIESEVLLELKSLEVAETKQDKLLADVAFKKKTLCLEEQLAEAHAQIDDVRIESAKEIKTIKDTAATLTEATTRGLIAPKGQLLSVVIEKYCKEKVTKEEWQPKAEKESRVLFALLLEIVGDIPITDITRDMAKSFRDKQMKLPKGRSVSKKYSHLTIDELIALDLPEASCISKSTINGRMGDVSGMFKDAMREKENEELTRNVFEGLQLNSKKTIIVRKPFNTKDLTTLFGSGGYKLRAFDKAFKYWLVPMALFTGARLNELAQLHTNDIIQVNALNYESGATEQIWCFRIDDAMFDNEGNEVASASIPLHCEKRLKNDAARRQIPIHPFLLNMGFLSFVAKIKANGHVRLFPEIRPTELNHHADAPSKWFGRYREACGLTEEGKVFHSFRHTFSTEMQSAGVPAWQVGIVLGHADALLAAKTYGITAEPLCLKKQTVERLPIPQEVLALIPKYDEITTIKALRPRKRKC